jgi:hypothetical protein
MELHFGNSSQKLKSSYSKSKKLISYPTIGLGGKRTSKPEIFKGLIIKFA